MEIDLKKAMPLLARHEGIWDGMYRYYGPTGDKFDEHTSRLICRFPDDGEFPYVQTNYYRWPDGRVEDRGFPASYKFGRVEFHSDLIEGWAAEVAQDDFRRTVMLYWQRRGEPDLLLYEMIQLSDCGQFRSRVWHWFKHGRIVQRTLIDEERVSHDWRSVSEPSYAGDPVK